MRIRSSLTTWGLVAGIVAAGALSPVTALADGPLRLDLQLGNSCVSGHKPSDQPVKVKLLRRDGTAIDTKHDGTTLLEWKVCFRRAPVAGNKLQLVNGTEDRTVTVPDLTVEVDRVAGRVSGHGPVGKTIQLRYHDCDPSSRCVKGPVFTALTDLHGHYHKDLSSSVDIDGSDLIRADYFDARGDRFFRLGYAPYMEITKPNRIAVSCMPLGTTTVRLLSSSGVLRGSKTFTASTACSGASGSFRKNGHPVNVHAGDRIRGDLASDAVVTWPEMAVTGVDYQLDGHCLKNARYVVLLSAGFSTSWAGTTDDHGDFTADLLGFWSFQAGDHLDLICESGPGDRVRMVRILELV